MCAQTDKDRDNCLPNNVIVSYRFAKKLHIARLRSHKNKVHKTIRKPNGVKLPVTMALSRPDRRTRSADKMRDYNAQNTKHKLREFKPTHCPNSDKAGYSPELKSGFGNQQSDVRARDCIARSLRMEKQPFLCTRSNPDLASAKKCSNSTDALLKSNCVRHGERLKSGQIRPAGTKGSTNTTKKVEPPRRYPRERFESYKQD